MRLIILNQFFYPDHSATSQLMTDLAESLVEQGVVVTALAGRGRYNGGDALPAREHHQGVNIERAWATNFGKRTLAGRLIDYCSFYPGATWKLWRLPRHDVVMALTTPPLIGLIALLVSRARGMRMVALVQDVYPDVAVALGALAQRSLATRFFDYLNRLTLCGADRIVVLGDCMRERIAEKVGAQGANRIDVIHNWADGSQIKPLHDERNVFTEEHGLENNFVVLFSGNLGLVNEFTTVLEAARILAEKRPEVVFLFIGEGARASEIRDFAHRHQLSNVRMLPYQPRHALRHSLAAGHVSLVTLAPGLAGFSVPSKTYGILAAGRPVLFVGDPHSDVARLIDEHQCGAVIAAGDSRHLAQVVANWASDKSALAALNDAARILFEARFDRPHAVRAYLETFDRCLGAVDKNRTPHSIVTSAHKARGDAAKIKETSA